MLTHSERTRLNAAGYWTFEFSANVFHADARTTALYAATPNRDDGGWSGPPQAFLDNVHEEDRPLANSSGISLEQNETGSLQRSRPFRINTPRGVRWVRYTSYLEYDTPDRAYGFAIDCTDEVELQSRIAQLEQTSAERERLENSAHMAAPMAHDLANLLTVLLPTLTMVQDEVPPNSDLAPLMDSAVQAGRSISHLSRQLVTLVRGTAPARSVDVIAEVESSSRLLERSLPANITLRTILPDESLYGWFPPGAISQSIVNLVLNARDALGARTGTIEIHVRSDNVDAIIEVRDDGPGIPDALRRTLGRAFQSTKGEGGTGFGLYMVRTLAEKHGGQFAIHSGEGGGTTVVFSTRRVPPAHLSLARSANTDLRGVSVIVFEENEQVRSVLCHVVRSGGADVHECTGVEVMSFLARSVSADSVLLVGDSNIEGQRGPLQCIQLAREVGISRFVWTGTDAVDLPEDILVIAKPFEVMQLLIAVGDAARMSR